MATKDNWNRERVSVVRSVLRRGGIPLTAQQHADFITYSSALVPAYLMGDVDLVPQAEGGCVVHASVQGINLVWLADAEEV